MSKIVNRHANNHAKEQFGSRIQLAEEILCTLFKATTFYKVIVLLSIWNKNKVFEMLREILGMNIDHYKFVPKQMLDVHFQLGKFSYRLLDSIGSSLSKASDGFVCFENSEKLRAYRDSLQTGKIHMF